MNEHGSKALSDWHGPGDGMQWDGRALFSVYIARTVTQPPDAKQRWWRERGNGKSTMGELTLVGAQ